MAPIHARVRSRSSSTAPSFVTQRTISRLQKLTHRLTLAQVTAMYHILVFRGFLFYFIPLILDETIDLEA